MVIFLSSVLKPLFSRHSQEIRHLGSVSILQLTEEMAEEMVAGWCKIETVSRTRHDGPSEFGDRFHGSETAVWSCVVVLQQDILHCQQEQPSTQSRMCAHFINYRNVNDEFDPQGQCRMSCCNTTTHDHTAVSEPWKRLTNSHRPSCLILLTVPILHHPATISSAS